MSLQAIRSIVVNSPRVLSAGEKPWQEKNTPSRVDHKRGNDTFERTKLHKTVYQDKDKYPSDETFIIDSKPEKEKYSTQIDNSVRFDTETALIYLEPFEYETSTKTQTPPFENYEDAIEYAKAKIDYYLSDIGGSIEYALHIDDDGSVTREVMGDVTHCKNDTNYINSTTTIIHGHPNNSPLSPNDVIILLTTPAKKMIAVGFEGSESSLEKTDVKVLADKRQAMKDINYIFMKTVAAYYGYEAEDDWAYVVDEFKKYAKTAGFTDSLIEKMSDTDSLKEYLNVNSPYEAIEVLQKMAIIHGQTVEHKATASFMDLMNKVDDEYCNSDEFKTAINEFLYEVASIYGLKYSCDMDFTR